jgi:hypothetical protein
MKNQPNILAGRETPGRLKKQKCLNPVACETPRAVQRGCYLASLKPIKHRTGNDCCNSMLDIEAGTPTPLLLRIPSPRGAQN